ETCLAVPTEPVAFLIELNRLVERSLSTFEQAHDLLKARERRLEAQFALLFGRVHQRGMTLLGCRINRAGTGRECPGRFRPKRLRRPRRRQGPPRLRERAARARDGAARS